MQEDTPKPPRPATLIEPFPLVQETEPEPRSRNLGTLRAGTTITQAGMAERLGWTQFEVNQVEQTPILGLAVVELRAYVAALGGRIEISIPFRGQTAKVRL